MATYTLADVQAWIPELKAQDCRGYLFTVSGGDPEVQVSDARAAEIRARVLEIIDQLNGWGDTGDIHTEILGNEGDITLGQHDELLAELEALEAELLAK